MIKKIAFFLASVAPGVFLIGYNIGTGSITTMATAGAGYGMALIWPLVLSCLFTYFLIISFGEYTMVTGNTILYSYRKHFGNAVALFILASLLISEWVSSMGVMGIVVQVVQEWSRPLTKSGNGFNPIIMALLFGGIIYYIFWQGRHRFFEKILTLFVSIMGLSFLLTMFMVKPDPAEILQGLVPRIVRGENSFLIMAGMVGTTMGGILYVVRSILVQEKGWTIKDMKIEKRDAKVSVIFMFVLSAAIMIAAAGTMYTRGLKVENAIDMVNLMEPLAGRFATSLFVAGIVSAGLSSLFPIVLLAPWLFADYNHKPRNLKSKSSRLLVLFGVLIGLVVPIFGGRPVMVMILSQALTILATPVIIFFLMLLINKKEIMGEHRPGLLKNMLTGLILAFTILMAYAGVVGIKELF